MRINRFLEIQVQVKVLFTFHVHVERILIIGSFVSFFSLCPRHDRWSLSSSRRATQPSRRSASRPCSRLPSGRTLSASSTMKSQRTAGSLTLSAKLLVCHSLKIYFDSYVLLNATNVHVIRYNIRISVPSDDCKIKFGGWRYGLSIDRQSCGNASIQFRGFFYEVMLS